MDLAHQQLCLSMLKKNVRLELMYKRGFRPSHALWVDTYNKQFGGGIIYTILAGVSSRNHYYVAVELWISIVPSSLAPIAPLKTELSFIRKVFLYAYVGGKGHDVDKPKILLEYE